MRVRVKDNASMYAEEGLVNFPPYSSYAGLEGETTKDEPINGYEVCIDFVDKKNVSFRWYELEILD